MFPSHQIAWIRVLVVATAALVLIGPAPVPVAGDEPPKSSSRSDPGPPTDSTPPADPAAPAARDTQTETAEKPAPAPPAEPRPEIFILEKPEDLAGLQEKLADPDFVILRGSDYLRMLERAQRPGDRDEDSTAGVTAVAVGGEVLAGLAHLTITYDLATRDAEPTWIPIRLSGQTVTQVREADHTLPIRQAEGGNWQVEVRGAGRHEVRVSALAPVKVLPEGRRIELAIPEAARTEVRLEVDQQIADATAGQDRVAVEPVEGGGRSLLVAHLPPRARLELTWRPETDPGIQLPPLLTARGQMALTIDPDSFRIDSSWAISSVRGTSRNLELRLDPADELLELKLDGAALPTDIQRDDGTSQVVVPLADPIRPGAAEPHLLVMTTRRPLPAERRLTFTGFPLTQATMQTGVIAISQGGNLWISGTPGPGLYQIDPRTDLPDELRARPSIVLAYQFSNQPFELGLRIDPSPPWVRVAAYSTVKVEARRAQVDTWLDYQVARGQVYEVRLGLPKGLEPEAAGPPEVVASSQVLTEPAADPNAPPRRILALRLAAGARADQSGVFRIHLTGRTSLDLKTGSPQAVPIPLFVPEGAAVVGGQLIVQTARDVTAELEDAPAIRGSFNPAVPQPASEWSWSSEPSEAGITPALWFRCDGNPETLPLRVTIHPRSLSCETRLLAEVSRSRLNLRQDTTCRVQFGSLIQLEVDVPPSLDGHWDLEGDEVARRELLGPRPDGLRRYRLILAREVSDSLRLRFRLRLPMAHELAAETPTALEVPWIRVVEGTAAPVQVEVAAEPGISLAPGGQGWSPVSDDGPLAPPPTGTTDRLTLTRTDPSAGPPTVTATASPLAPLPGLIASRLWVRTIQGPAGLLRTSAWYRLESHGPALSFTLPPGATLLSVRVGNSGPVRLDQISQPAAYRLPLPQDAPPGPLVVALEYTVPTPPLTTSWQPPRLLDRGLVQQTLWEVWVPWNRAAVGVPEGWTDENRWFWDLYVWKRQPWMDTRALTAWIAGPGAAETTSKDLIVEGRGYHSYLFGRLGPPATLRPFIVSRALLVGVCSGLVLGLGLSLLIWRPRGLWVGSLVLALGIAVAVAVHPSVTFVLLQSSGIGLLLTLVAMTTRSLVERRRPASRYSESSGLVVMPASGSSTSMVGSEGSTVLRPRPAPIHERPPSSSPSPSETSVGETRS